jgi:hypothetical protein
MTLNFDVTRRKLQLGTRDPTTGWYDKNYAESTIDMVFQKGNATVMNLPGGAYVRVDKIGMTLNPVEQSDEIKTQANRYYEVKAVEPVYAPADNFLYRDCGLVYLPMHDLSYSNLTPTVEDARYRTKDYWETYIDGSNLNAHNFTVCYADPDYPLVKVFLTKGVHIIFAVDQPNSAPLIGHDRAAYGYEESVPTHVLTLDTQLQWLAEAELRRICETYPSGSQRSLERRTSHDRWLGSVRLYDTEYIMNYRRDPT